MQMTMSEPQSELLYVLFYIWTDTIYKYVYNVYIFYVVVIDVNCVYK